MKWFRQSQRRGLRPIGAILAVVFLASVLTGIGAIKNSPLKVLSAQPAEACINCPVNRYFWDGNPTPVYTKVVLNGTNMDISTYNKYMLISVQNRGEPTWSGTICSRATYNGNWSYGPLGQLTQTLYKIHIDTCYDWGPGDHIVGYSVQPPHMEYMTGGSCCYLTAGAHETIANWYHLPGRNIDSGFRINLHFHVNQCIAFLPKLPCGGMDVLMYQELHGNGTQAWEGHGGGVTSLHLDFLP